MPVKHQPDQIYLRHVPLKRVHLFTFIQVVCLALLWVLKSFREPSILFPLMVWSLFFFLFFHLFHGILGVLPRCWLWSVSGSSWISYSPSGNWPCWTIWCPNRPDAWMTTKPLARRSAKNRLRFGDFFFISEFSSILLEFSSILLELRRCLAVNQDEKNLEIELWKKNEEHTVRSSGVVTVALLLVQNAPIIRRPNIRTSYPVYGSSQFLVFREDFPADKL